MKKFTIYHWKYNGSTRVVIVPNHYCKSLQYIKKTLELAESWGLTIPKDEDIEFQVLAGDRHRRMLSIEFNSVTEPIFDTKNIHFTDIDKYPHMSSCISTP
jgi:hypothetical protein